MTSLPLNLSDSELNLVQQVAGCFDTYRRADLLAELAQELVKQKQSHDPGAGNWMGYLWTVLRHKAIDLVEAWRKIDKRSVPLDAECPSPDSSPELIARIALEQSVSNALASVNERHKSFFSCLAESGGRIGQAAAASGIHRNTARAWVQDLRAKASSPPPAAGSNAPPSKRTPSAREPYIGFPRRLWNWWKHQKLSGTQHNILLWTLGATFGWHRDSARFSWYRIAKELGLDRGGTVRAGNALKEAGIIQVSNGRIKFGPAAMTGDIDPAMSKCSTRAMTLDTEDDVRSPRFSDELKKGVNKCREKRKEKIQKKKMEPQGEAGAATPIPGKYGHVDAES